MKEALYDSHINGGTGDVSSRFVLANKKIKAQVMAQVVAESSRRITISKKEEELLSYEEGISCKQ